MRATILLLVASLLGCNSVGVREAESQSVGPIGLTSVAADNDTLSGSGTSANQLVLAKVYVDGTSLTGSGTTASPLESQWIGAAQHIFGDCSDGDLSISSGTTTLSRDTFYEDLSITGTATLATNGWRVYVCQTLTFADTGRITANGGNGGTPTAGTAGGGNYLGGGTGGGTGGSTAGGVAGAGTNITLLGRGCGTAAAPAGTNNGNACLGGGGGSGASGAGAAGGTGTLATAASGDIHSFRGATDGRQASSTTAFSGGGGGGGGRGDAANVKAGGGGGGGGGYASVAAREVANTGCHASGCVQALGGRGGDGQAAGNTGSGGGGGGGVVTFIIGRGTIPTLSAAGGSAGTPQGTGTSGGNGGSGLTISYRIEQ